MIMKYRKMLASHRKIKSWKFLENVFFLGLLLNGDDKVTMTEKKYRSLINISVNSLKI